MFAFDAWKIMLRINYMGFIIQLNYLSKYREWFVSILDSNQKIIVSNQLPTQKQAEGWSKYMIENLTCAEN